MRRLVGTGSGGDTSVDRVLVPGLVVCTVNVKRNLSVTTDRATEVIQHAAATERGCLAAACIALLIDSQCSVLKHESLAPQQRALLLCSFYSSVSCHKTIVIIAACGLHGGFLGGRPRVSAIHCCFNAYLVSHLVGR